MGRFCFAVKEGWRHRKMLKSFLSDRSLQIHQLDEITSGRLDQEEIAILALDFDGVLAGHDADQPLPAVVTWLQQLCQNVGEQRIVLLTNKPKAARLAYFAKHFPLIHIVQDVRKKPYPDGLKEIIAYKNVPAHRVVLLDDRLLTGMLATCLAHCRGWYFRYPYRRFWHAPLRETWFSCLRGFERLFWRL